MLDVAEAHIDDANKNVHDAKEDLDEAVRQHMSANKKKICIFLIVLAVLLAILVPIIVKFS
jgi:t-SNARE complex subunit (syntaxin)